MNPRNAAAGTMRNLDPRLVSAAPAGGVTYQVVAPGVPLPPTPFRRCSRRCATWGLPVEPHWQRCDGHRRGHRVLPRLGRQAPRPAVRHRRRRHQAGRSRAARASWARPPSSRAGPPRSSSPREQARTKLLGHSTSTSAAPARIRRTPCWSRCSSPDRPISMATLHNAEDIARKDFRDGDTVVHREGRRRHPARRRAGARGASRRTRRRG